MKLLLLGYSHIARRKLLPLIADGSLNLNIDVASETRVESIDKNPVFDHVFLNYEMALEKTHAEIVYISTINSKHAELILECLKRGFHVLVDKPVMLDQEQLETAINLASAKNLCLSEVIVWQHHAQISMIKDFVNENNIKIDHIRAVFGFPPLPASNFRWDRKLGGGVFNDLAPYAVSMTNYFFGNEKMISSSVMASDWDNNFARALLLNMQLKNLSTSNFYFSFNMPYTNYLELYSDEAHISLSRVFTIPHDYQNEISIRYKDGTQKRHMAKTDNTFKNYFADLLEKLNHGNYQLENEQLFKNQFMFNQLKSQCND